MTSHLTRHPSLRLQVLKERRRPANQEEGRAMYLMYYTDDDDKRVYTLEVDSLATYLSGL